MDERKVFLNSVVPIPVESGTAPGGLLVAPASDQHRAERMRVHFSLALPESAERDLEAKVARGETVPGDELTGYGARQADAQALSGWLTSNGYQVEHASADHTSIYASAPVAQVEQTLQVHMVRVDRDGFAYTAAREAPSLPASVGGPVLAISGLQPFRHMRKHSRRGLPRGNNRGQLRLTAQGTPEFTTNVSNAPPYLPSEVLTAYNGAGLGLDGSDQTIAILIDTFPDDSDMEAFWRLANVPAKLTQIEKVNVRGGQLPAPSGEETLDTQWTSGIAPGATIRVYATGGLDFTSLDQALDRIIDDIPSQPTMRQLSISLGLGETYVPGDEVAIQHQKFLKLAAAGVNVFVSSGDAGSNPGQSRGSAGPLQAEYEASDPRVIAVGGTTLELAADGTVASETGWPGSGGGISTRFRRPGWQAGTGITGNRRLVPDISATADPDYGALIILNGEAQQFGGTSWAAPTCAGICAIINQARVNAGKQPLPFLARLIYPPTGSCFRDITTGSNGSYHAQPGYDLVTGLGVPDVQALVHSLS